MTNPPGTLSVVATPLGNLGDISPRAVETLKCADLILAEDTRVFGKLAERFGISAPKKSYFEQNERERAEEVLVLLKAGKQVALVSDAGTPGVSDPGYRIVHACREAKINIVAVPGACAAVAALSISGLPCDRFFFEGFLPSKKGKKENTLRELLALDSTVICYDSPHRVVETLRILEKLASERTLFLAREMTKIHEEGLYGTAAEILEILEARKEVKGEVVLLLAPAEK